MGGKSSKAIPAPKVKVQAPHELPSKRIKGSKPEGTLFLQQDLAVVQTGSKSEPGFGADEEGNHDCVVSGELPNGIAYCALFDGHGEHGRLISQTLLSATAAVLLERCGQRGPQQLGDGLTLAFSDLHASCVALADGVADLSGASGTVVLFSPETREVCVGNVGNSKAVIGKASGSFEQLTKDHYATADGERARIVAAGGRVAATEDAQLGELGEMNVWKGAQVLQPISRSLGDLVGESVGVCSECAVRNFKLRSGHRFLVLGSSGVWKVMTPSNVVDLLLSWTSVRDATGVAEKLCDEAMQRWSELWQSENTSVIVLLFPTQPSPTQPSQ